VLKRACLPTRMLLIDIVVVRVSLKENQTETELNIYLFHENVPTTSFSATRLINNNRVMFIQ